MFVWAHCKVVFFQWIFFFFLCPSLFVILVVWCVLQWEERRSRRCVAGNAAAHCNFDVKFVHVLCHSPPTCRSTRQFDKSHPCSLILSLHQLMEAPLSQKSHKSLLFASAFLFHFCSTFFNQQTHLRAQISQISYITIIALMPGKTNTWLSPATLNDGWAKTVREELYIGVSTYGTTTSGKSRLINKAEDIRHHLNWSCLQLSTSL